MRRKEKHLTIRLLSEQHSFQKLNKTKQAPRIREPEVQQIFCFNREGALGPEVPIRVAANPDGRHGSP
jgi:hypothetical protein